MPLEKRPEKFSFKGVNWALRVHLNLALMVESAATRTTTVSSLATARYHTLVSNGPSGWKINVGCLHCLLVGNLGRRKKPRSGPDKVSPQSSACTSLCFQETNARHSILVALTPVSGAQCAWLSTNWLTPVIAREALMDSSANLTTTVRLTPVDVMEPVFRWLQFEILVSLHSQFPLGSIEGKFPDMKNICFLWKYTGTQHLHVRLQRTLHRRQLRKSSGQVPSQQMPERWRMLPQHQHTRAEFCLRLSGWIWRLVSAVHAPSNWLFATESSFWFRHLPGTVQKWNAETHQNVFFSGTLCEIDVNECASSPCVNSGTCVESNSRTNLQPFFLGYRCICLPGFAGSFNKTAEIDSLQSWSELCTLWFHSPLAHRLVCLWSGKKRSNRKYCGIENIGWPTWIGKGYPCNSFCFMRQKYCFSLCRNDEYLLETQAHGCPYTEVIMATNAMARHCKTGSLCCSNYDLSSLKVPIANLTDGNVRPSPVKTKESARKAPMDFSE